MSSKIRKVDIKRAFRSVAARQATQQAVGSLGRDPCITVLLDKLPTLFYDDDHIRGAEVHAIIWVDASDVTFYDIEQAAIANELREARED